MNKLRRSINSNSIYIGAVLLVLVILLPLIPATARPMSIREFALLDAAHNLINLTLLRAKIIGLVLANITLIYGLISNWFGKRRAGLVSFIMACMPVWILMQLAVPRFTLVLTPTLLALWSFDRAGRSNNRAALWYALCGLSITAAWVQEPLGVSILMLICGLLLIVVKPRYITHIARQASLVLIILLAAIGAISAASWKFDLGIQEFLVRQLSLGTHLTISPQLLVNGPHTYVFGLPGISLIPLSIVALAGLGVWQLILARKRPRNIYVTVLPILLFCVGIQFNAMTALLLVSLAMICVSTWAVMGVQYLHNSWRQVFPRNKLAKSFGDVIVAAMLASLAMYSFWYIHKGWNGNPQARNDARIEWKGEL